MMLSRAELRTTHAVEYLRELCRHWAHRFPVEYDDTHGKIKLDRAICTLMSAPAALSVYLEVEDAADQDDAEKLIADRLRHIGSQETLDFHWFQS
ncbi:DUF2218 domain-containing protein [Granulicella tundricola]|uniref:Uncharacterized conserved protein UCP028291 n=1 Tax=Granulicella tundricola (strain ATCC BAA-1859 / DSM 23138 / MP5ACTX9) TaxID=1198114 RepID=E8WVT9_GRATM|nr:DUF2218 domain-containing protein [Granulicella tundricola]ADW70698.1 Uncharacterized conserved protein UCP028291 [Granulicella tundricola MP5ACTX9]